MAAVTAKTIPALRVVARTWQWMVDIAVHIRRRLMGAALHPARQAVRLVLFPGAANQPQAEVPTAIHIKGKGKGEGEASCRT